MVQENGLSIRILRLEQKLESYQRLHAEELNEIRLALVELKKQVLGVATSQQQAALQIHPSRGSSERSS